MTVSDYFDITLFIVLFFAALLLFCFSVSLLFSIVFFIIFFLRGYFLPFLIFALPHYSPFVIVHKEAHGVPPAPSPKPVPGGVQLLFAGVGFAVISVYSRAL